MINAMAPVIGVLISEVFRLSDDRFVPTLSALAGVFIYIGASDLLPRSHRLDRRIQATMASVAGLGIVYLITQLQG